MRYRPRTHSPTEFLKAGLPHHVEDTGGEDEEAVSLATLRPKRALCVQLVRAVRLHRLEGHCLHGQNATWGGQDKECVMLSD